MVCVGVTDAVPDGDHIHSDRASPPVCCELPTTGNTAATSAHIATALMRKPTRCSMLLAWSPAMPRETSLMQRAHAPKCGTSQFKRLARTRQLRYKRSTESKQNGE